MMTPQGKRQVTIEDLLRVKRAERPPAEFWDEFDRELRAKQLAALVEKRPWWQVFPASLAKIARYRVPLGATAVLALTFLTVREYQFQPTRLTPPANVGDTEVAANVASPTTETSGTRAAPVAVTAPQVSDEPAATPNTVAATPAMPTADALPASSLTRMMPMLAGADSASLRPSARSVAQNRAVAEAMLGTSLVGFEARGLPQPAKIVTQEPLAQMSNPAETRRSRFAVAFASAQWQTSSAPTQRVARRLSDEQLYDTIHRFGASGNSVSFRF